MSHVLNCLSRAGLDQISSDFYAFANVVAGDTVFPECLSVRPFVSPEQSR